MPPAPGVWLYQPYPAHDARWDTGCRDRLTAPRGVASRIDTLGSRFSVEVLRDGDALVAVIDPQRRSGGTVTALRRVHPGTPVIHVDVRHRRTSIHRHVDAATSPCREEDVWTHPQCPTVLRGC